MAKLTKKAKSLAGLDREALYTVDDAIKTIKELATAKFDETIEVAMNLGVDPRHADQMVRGMVSLPAGTGKDMKVAVFARGDKADAASAAGADKVGAEDLMEDMQAGNLDYGRRRSAAGHSAASRRTRCFCVSGIAPESLPGVRRGAACGSRSRTSARLSACSGCLRLKFKALVPQEWMDCRAPTGVA